MHPDTHMSYNITSINHIYNHINYKNPRAFIKSFSLLSKYLDDFFFDNFFF